jgi:hypothetical protein
LFLVLTPVASTPPLKKKEEQMRILARRGLGFYLPEVAQHERPEADKRIKNAIFPKPTLILGG